MGGYAGYTQRMPKRPKVEPSSNPTLFDMENSPKGPDLFSERELERSYSQPNLLLGTSSFTASGWEGSFYPKGMKSSEYLSHYAKSFRTVESDSSFYGTPSAAAVEGWYRKTPADFIFAAKVPQIITHQKILKDCEAEFEEFLDRMTLLKEKLGPLLLQFPFFNKYDFKTGSDFLARLRLFLGKLPATFPGKFVVEIRNRTWLDERFLDTLREHKVALALTDTSFVPRPWELKKPLDLITVDFAYVRWLGNRKQIETVTTTWDKTIVDRTEDLANWANFLRSLVLDKRLRMIFAFANNHYAGHGPATVKLFWELYEKR